MHSVHVHIFISYIVTYVNRFYLMSLTSVHNLITRKTTEGKAITVIILCSCKIILEHSAEDLILVGQKHCN